MRLICMNLDEFHHFIHGVRAFDFELAIFQEEILALETDSQFTERSFPPSKVVYPEPVCPFYRCRSKKRKKA